MSLSHMVTHFGQGRPFLSDPPDRFRSMMNRQVKLQVACRQCGSQILSPIQMDPESFKTATLTGNTYQCPACGKSDSFDKEDHFFDTAN